ncbi:DUF2460 domain-containing protein, partial [uncultured Sphingorhabdus sp.]|uniref:DUF2460 domain-containing protein n=1 Tax=uncultured Sphingorhabdus sp. TaxID=1686106 RepID=UPI00262FA3F9
VGEPWWWTMPDGRICLYDAAAQAAFGPLAVSIPDIRGSKTATQMAMLDKAGELLAASTADLVAAVEDEAGTSPFTSHLLVYLPTVIDPLSPEAKRANVPLQWASPAFDVLQLEDYDWVTTGNHGATARGFAEMNARLGYPVAQQHYFSGFVLQQGSDAQWFDIERAIELAKTRATAEVYVWALPQVARDGFVHFQIGNESEADVEAFHDILFPLGIGREAEVSAEFSTNVVTLMSGHERRNSDWADARMAYNVAPGVRSEAELIELMQFFRARRGAAVGFRFRDPFDNSSNDNNDAPNILDQLLGTGDGIRTSFQLLKRYGDGDSAQERTITRPTIGSIRVAIDGLESSAWSLGPLGEIQFEMPPPAGVEVTAGFHFDVPVRFDQDRIDVSRSTFGAADMPNVMLVEIKEVA